MACGIGADRAYFRSVPSAADRKQGGLGELKYPLVADLKKEISDAYGVLSPDGIALRGLFIIDKEGVVQHSTINNLAFGRSVDETLRTLQVGTGWAGGECWRCWRAAAGSG